jgi:hypothetical protein
MEASIPKSIFESLASPAPALANLRANQQVSRPDFSASISLSSAEDDVSVLTTGDRMDLPPKNILFVDTSDFSAEDNLQAALLLFKSYPHLFKIPSFGSKGSKKTIMICAMVPLLETDDMTAAEVLRHNPFESTSSWPTDKDGNLHPSSTRTNTSPRSRLS